MCRPGSDIEDPLFQLAPLTRRKLRMRIYPPFLKVVAPEDQNGAGGIRILA